MKNSLAFVFCLLLLTASHAFAFPVQQGDLVKFSHGRGGRTGGGEFIISDAANGGNLFATFCLEYNEPVNYRDRFQVTSIAPYAEKGGISGAVNGKDYIQNSTKWLYWHYVNDTLDDAIDGFTYGYHGANAVQYAIWAFEGEVKYIPFEEYEFVYLAADDFANNSFSSSFGNVQVMNIINYDEHSYAQSQLIAAPVPEPATMLLMGTGLLGLAGLGRKKMRSN